MWTTIDETPIRRGTNTYRRYRCECGLEAEVNSHSVVSGRSTGCRKCEGLRRRKSPNYLAWAYLRNHYTTGATRRGLCWNITDEDFLKITQQNCAYCGISPAQVITRKHATYIYNGIDRVDNTKGYELDNVVACCKICNYAKNNLTQEQWIAWLIRIGDRWNSLTKM